jgi:hypothetical protein
LFVNCDKMVGGQFEQGLDNLRQLLESRDQAAMDNAVASMSA